jgi:HAD superfamily phosphatase (TIGR01668 family)
VARVGGEGRTFWVGPGYRRRLAGALLFEPSTVLIALLTPHHRLDSVGQITPEWLRGLGVRGLLVDLDCTLVDDRDSECPRAAVAWVGRMRSASVPLCIVSNSRRERVAPMAGHPDLRLPFVCGARKPLTGGLRAALLRLELPACAVAVVGDQVFTDVLGGRLLGARTILVRPTTREARDKRWATQWKRPLERLLLRGRP